MAKKRVDSRRGVGVSEELLQRITAATAARRAKAHENQVEGEASVRVNRMWSALDESGAALVGVLEYVRKNPDQLNEKGLQKQVEKRVAGVRHGFDQRIGYLERTFGPAKTWTIHATDQDRATAEQYAAKWHRLVQSGSKKAVELIVNDWLRVLDEGRQTLIDLLVDDADALVDDALFDVVPEIRENVAATREAQKFSGHFAHDYAQPYLRQARQRYMRLEQKTLTRDVAGMVKALRMKDGDGAYHPLVCPGDVGLGGTDQLLRKEAPEITDEARPVPSTRLHDALVGPRASDEGGDDE